MELLVNRTQMTKRCLRTAMKMVTTSREMKTMSTTRKIMPTLPRRVINRPTKHLLKMKSLAKMKKRKRLSRRLKVAKRRRTRISTTLVSLLMVTSTCRSHLLMLKRNSTQASRMSKCWKYLLLQRATMEILLKVLIK